jgi:hypothetical protein
LLAYFIYPFFLNPKEIATSLKQRLHKYSLYF